MEPEAKAELVKARDTLERQLQIISNHRTVGGPRAIARKLRNQLREINELLESEGADDNGPTRSDALRRGDRQQPPRQPISRGDQSWPKFIEGMSFRFIALLCLTIGGALLLGFENIQMFLYAQFDLEISLIAFAMLAVGLFGLKRTPLREKHGD